jgi:hypothetical protein
MMAFVYEISLSYFVQFRKILPHAAAGFTSPPKEGVLRFLSLLKTVAGFEPSEP